MKIIRCSQQIGRLMMENFAPFPLHDESHPRMRSDGDVSREKTEKRRGKEERKAREVARAYIHGSVSQIGFFDHLLNK